MHYLQKEIGIPKIQTKSISDNTSVFVIEPLPSGYGVTLGNALRRILLSSIPGAAISAVKIDGVSHEYSTISHMKESVLDILLNLKQLNLRKHTSEPETITLEVKKQGEILASDIKTTQNIEILNPDLVIATCDSKSAALKMEILVEKGVGYSPVAERKGKHDDPDFMLVDSVFSPVRSVQYHVDAARVGQMTNLDKLSLEVTTNGSITPEDALKFSSNLVQSYFHLFNEENQAVEEEFISDADSIRAQEKEEEEPPKENYTPIEILNFSPRTLNALINGGIGSIEQLVKCTPSKLGNFRGFGKKAMDEVSAALKTRNLSLSEDEDFSDKKED